ncbi:MAG: hypothetical protein IKL28_02535 [Lachnospiraceae bacterium]|nr:hypothetical protein [Lachnospiraceae bacterium]
MADKNFIFFMKPYNVDALTTQVAWMLEKRTELASRKRLPGLWKITDKLNATPRATEAELKHRRERKRWWGGLFLIMGIFLFIPGVMKPQELPIPLIVGFLAIVMGVLYLRRDDKKKNSYEKKATRLLADMNASMEGQKLRLIFYDTELAMSGAGEDKRISYTNMECGLETSDLFGLVFENQIVILQKREVLLGTSEDFAKQMEPAINRYCKHNMKG